MTASGWQTAPPQVVEFEVVLVTNSACPQYREASLRVPDLPGIAQSALKASAPTAEFSGLTPVVELRSRASASPILSVPR
jgi:hypothetical protein